MHPPIAILYVRLSPHGHLATGSYLQTATAERVSQLTYAWPGRRTGVATPTAAAAPWNICRCDNSGRSAVAVFVNSFFEKRVEQLFDLAQRIEQAFSSAGLEYRVVGGLAAYLYVEERDPDAGRLTRDIDIAVRRGDLPKIAKAVEPFGLQYRHVAGVDMLVSAGEPSARRAAHLVFTGEKVREDYPEPTPELGGCRTVKGIRLMPPADLVRMKLTSFRAKDEAHLKDLDEAGLITPEIEAGLSPLLRARLERVRARE